jgi:hypothetical protein
VTYDTVAYHKRKMDRVELNGGIDLRLPAGRMRIIGPEFVDVCIPQRTLIYSVLY